MLDYDHGYENWHCPGSDEIFTISQKDVETHGIPHCVVCGIKLTRV